jgi:phosphatidate cytidylyltransferase
VKRVLTAAVLIPLVMGLTFWGSNRSVRLALAFVALLCLSEFVRLAARFGAEPVRLVVYLAGAWVVAAEVAPGAPFFLGITLLLLTLAMRGGRELSGLLGSLGAALAGILYVGVPFRMGGDLHQANPHLLFYCLVVNWLGDSAAYYAGRAFGRRRLAPRISPNKTWEGAIASVAATAAAGTWYLQRWAPEAGAWPLALGLSVAANIAGQVGDLAESAIKRGAGVKDSGALLPGHGGMLDRVDSLLFILPVVWWAVMRGTVTGP